MSPALATVLALLAGYLLGSFPTSVVVGKLFYGKDPRDFGSGNAGGTNSFRVFGWKAGLVVSLADLGKGALAAWLGARLASVSPAGVPEEFAALGAGLAAVAGHVWTVFAGFRGGKGVATAAGVVLAMAPLPSAAAALVFALTLLSTGLVSLSSILAAFSLALAASVIALAGGPVSALVLGFCWIVAPFIAFTHRANIGRLLRGEEKRFERLRILARRTGRDGGAGNGGEAPRG